MRKPVKNLLHGTLVLSVIFIAAELGLRAAGIGSEQIYRETGQGLIVRKPASSYLHRQENRNLVRYNNLGFHDRSRSRSSDAGTRIVVIGDSYVEGPQVPVEALFTSRAETLLTRQKAGVEILNAGTSGSNTGYQYVLWKHHLRPEIETNVLLLCLYLGDDLAQNHPVLNRRYLKRPVHDRHFFVTESGEVRLVRRERSPLILFFRSLTHHSRVLNFFYNTLARLRAQVLQAWHPPRAENAAAAPEPEETALEPYWNESIRGTMALIRRWEKELEEEGIRFAVMIIPSSASLETEGYGHPALDRLADSLRSWAREENVPLLEIDFSGGNPYRLYSFDGKALGHFSTEGHAQTGEQLAGWITKELLPQPSGR